MVRLKLSYHVANRNTECHFNSKMVRLKRYWCVSLLNQISYFNSKMVRFKTVREMRAIIDDIEFQFQNGAVKTFGNNGCTEFTSLISIPKWCG